MLFKDSRHSEKVIFLFLSQICSRPIQIHSRWIQISQRQQQSKNPFSYTDDDRHKNTFQRYFFYVSWMCLILPPTLARWKILWFFSCMVRAFLKLAGKTMSEHRGVISIKSEGVDLNNCTLVGSIRLSLQGFNAESLPNVVFAIKVLERRVRHKRV